MAPTTAITYVAPPRRTPYRYGLLDTAQVEAADPLRVPFGWETTACIQGAVWETDQCLIPDPPAQEKKPGDVSLSVSGAMFTPYAPADPCLRTQVLDKANAQAFERLRFAVEKLVSGRFWRVQLAPDAEDLHPGGAVDPQTAVGLLEQQLRMRYGAIGMLHAPAVFSPWATSMYDISWTVPRRTVLDTVWTFGGGYDGTGPDGADPDDGETWLYATGAVKILHADDVRHEAFDFHRNAVLAVAERPYGIAIDCGVVLGVRAKIDCCGSGGNAPPADGGYGSGGYGEGPYGDGGA